MYSIIDAHVHCRDQNQRDKETIFHALRVAGEVGLAAIFDMPNTDPPVISKKNVLERLALAERVSTKAFYGTHMGLTADKAQIKEAVETYKEYFPRVVGLKLYAGPSVGSLAVSKEEDQLSIYKTLTELGYEGVLVVHCEKESLLREDLWNPLKPITHTLARPPEAEIESVKDQIRFYHYSKFPGHLHITHISDPRTVEIVYNEKHNANISSAITPHHALLDKSIMERENGAFWKMNPPLNTKEAADTLLKYLKEGKIDIVSSDHAPHTYKEKTEKYLSGIPVLPFWPWFVNILKEKGFSEKRIREITFSNVAKIYGLEKYIKPREIKPLFYLAREYPADKSFDPFAHLK